MQNRPFRFGVTAAYAQSQAAWTTIARRAEELGYATLLIPDMPAREGLAPMIALAAAAQATTTLHLGSYVLGNDYRHPILIGREAASLDLLSGGRFELGLGVGAREAEFQHLGIASVSAGTRIGRLEETLQLLKRFFTEEKVDFSGKYYNITEVRGYPASIKQPRIPFLIAGISPRMLKLAGREADIIAIGTKITAHGFDPTDAPLEQKIAWIKEAAGVRFDNIELSQTVHYMQITDSPAPLSAQKGGPPIPKQSFSTEQAIEYLLEQRERYGFSYVHIYDGQMENFAPVVARLTGK